MIDRWLDGVREKLENSDSVGEFRERLGEMEIDVVQVFEPYADRLVSTGAGHEWHRLQPDATDAYAPNIYPDEPWGRRRRRICLISARTSP